MDRVELGSQGLVVSAIGLGCLSMSDFYGDAEERESIATVHHALDLGIDFLDTSDVYGPFTNEELVGRAIAGRRDEVTIATKWGLHRAPEGDWQGLDGSAAWCKQACEGSLRRLGVETIDLYYQHAVDPNTPIEESVGAMAELVREGKVRYIGLSNLVGRGDDLLERAHAVHPITAVQEDYSLLYRDLERDFLPVCERLGVGLVAFSPLARGLLSGKVRTTEEMFAGDFRRFLGSFTGENLTHNLRLVETLVEVGEAHGATPAQVALAWLLARGAVPIPGTSNRRRLDENAGAASLRLTGEELRLLDETFRPGVAAGANNWGREDGATAVEARKQARAAKAEG